MKICSTCKKEKDITCFHKNKINKDGLQYQCKECRVSSCAKSFKNISEGLKQKRNLSSKQWKNNNKNYVKEYGKKYKEENRAKFNSLQKLRETCKRNQTPIWVDSEELFLIEETYDLARLREKVTGFKWHVDHIVPLKGKKVSGLHTINNLQVIPAILNLRKSNKYEFK